MIEFQRLLGLNRPQKRNAINDALWAEFEFGPRAAPRTKPSARRLIGILIQQLVSCDHRQAMEGWHYWVTRGYCF